MRIALALLLVGCVTPGQLDTDEDTDGGSGNGSGTVDLPPSPSAAGAYHVRSDIDLTVEALLPEPAAETVVSLRNFSTNPAHTLIDLASAAGVPAVQALYGALPGVLTDRLEGWINTEIARLTIDGVPVTQVAATAAALAETALTQFALDSTLTIDGATATHTLETIDFTPAGIDMRYAVGSLPGDIISATATCSAQNGQLALGDHGYALEYGEYIWRAVNQVMTAQHGMDLRATLGTAVDCPALAHTIANKCYWSACVGHEPQLTEICERGLDEVVERVHTELGELRFDFVHLAAGTATLVDTDSDLIADRLDQGVWTAEINAGQGLRHVPTTFTAAR